jgi:hypothetical protein
MSSGTRERRYSGGGHDDLRGTAVAESPARQFTSVINGLPH